MECSVNTQAHMGDVKRRYIYGREYIMCDLCYQTTLTDFCNNPKVREYYFNRRSRR